MAKHQDGRQTLLKHCTQEKLTSNRDQELRFIVQDSTDYYKLKCSIFNDDKKTDLIGEVWIDLQTVVVPGGGQNDLWHQLNFKGKYAGDIRIELTFYDSRPKPDSLFDKKKQREKSHSTASDLTTSSAAGARQLGPREIKRRPLPPGPGGYSSPASPLNTPEQRPFSSMPLDMEPDAWINRQQNNHNPPPRPPKQSIMPETPDDVGYDFASDYARDQYEPMPSTMDLPYDQSPSFEDEQIQQRNQFGQRPSSQDYYQDQNPDQYAMDTYQQIPPMQEQRPHSSHRVNRSRDHFEPSTPNHPLQPVSKSSPYQSPPPNQPAQSVAAQQQQQPAWQNRGSPSPTKHAVYRDSPLRQSISQRDMPSQHQDYVQQPDDDDEPPPPPPAHGSQLVRMPMPPGAKYTGYDSPKRQSMNPNSVEERSPLQKLEYVPYQRSSPSAQDLDNLYSPAHSSEYNAGQSYDPYLDQSVNRRNSYNDTLDGFQPRSSPNGMVRYGPENIPPQRHGAIPHDDFRNSVGYGRAADAERRNSYGPPRRAQTFDSFEGPDDRQMRSSDPTLVRPRAISPNPAHRIPRKSITPTPTTPEGRNSLASTPFSPDSYDILNQSASPSADMDPFATPEQVKDAARQKELDKTRDLGPIIGNDGRIIDPSDHLPADTWAPEPERKNRKPEHVIRIRTREEARMHNRSGSSPGSARPHSIATSPYQPSPEFTQPPPSQNSPAIPPKLPPSPQMESPSGRNRLKKSMPNRPLPTGPYPHAHTSPAVMTVSSPAERPSPTTQRYSIASSSPNGHVQRPPLNDYQMPAGNTYRSRGGSGSGSTRPDFSYSPSSTKAPYSYPPPPSVADYSGYGADESLALELSTIDIGPSRGSRTAVRSSRGYGGY